MSGALSRGSITQPGWSKGPEIARDVAMFLFQRPHASRGERDSLTFRMFAQANVRPPYNMNGAESISFMGHIKTDRISQRLVKFRTFSSDFGAAQRDGRNRLALPKGAEAR